MTDLLDDILSARKTLSYSQTTRPKVAAPKSQNPDNLKALKRLREQPRGTQVESRTAAIKSLLGENEVFQTLTMLRWPQGVVCPRCHSNNVVKKNPPQHATDNRQYYMCLNCKGEEAPSDFDDFTGLPIQSIHSLKQWIFCWYLMGFCSLAQIAKVLGVSVHEVAHMATMGSELTEVPSAQAATLGNEKTEKSERLKKAEVEDQEDRSRSMSRSPFKPGPKSKF